MYEQVSSTGETGYNKSVSVSYDKHLVPFSQPYVNLRRITQSTPMYALWMTAFRNKFKNRAMNKRGMLERSMNERGVKEEFFCNKILEIDISITVVK